MHVDDQEVARLEVIETLTEEEDGEFFVESCPTVSRALDILRKAEKSPNLILLDYLIPGEDSTDVITEVMNNPLLKQRGIKIVWLTGSQRGATHAELIRSHGKIADLPAIIKNDYIGAQFRAVLRKILRGSQ